MSLTFRLIGGGLSLPLVSKRLSGLSGILSNDRMFGLIDTHKRIQQRNQHQSRSSNLVCDGTTFKLWNVQHRSNQFAITHSSIRLYSAQNPESDSLGQLVYKGRVGRMLRTLKMFSLSTSIIGLGFQPYMWMKFQNMPLGAAIPLFTVLNSFVFLNPLLIHYISKKYITDLYFNQDTKVFTAYVLTFFASRETITFVAADVVVPDVPNMFAMFTIRGRPFFVHEVDFTSIEIYKHMMGFDRPIDFSFLLEDKKDSTGLQDNKKENL